MKIITYADYDSFTDEWTFTEVDATTGRIVSQYRKVSKDVFDMPCGR